MKNDSVKRAKFYVGLADTETKIRELLEVAGYLQTPDTDLVEKLEAAQVALGSHLDNFFVEFVPAKKQAEEK